MIYHAETWPTHRWPNFSFSEEVCCKYTGRCDISETMMDDLQKMRLAFDRPLPINSAYRHETHPREQKKVDKGKPPGTHTYGVSVDIRCAPADMAELIALAHRFGFQGIGVAPKSEFLHIDQAPNGLYPAVIRPWLWTY